jgi:hypothetical protein
MVKGATAGNLLAGVIEKSIGFIGNWTLKAAKYSAHVSSMEQVTLGLAKAHGDGEAAAKKAIAAIQAVGFTTGDATPHTIRSPHAWQYPERSGYHAAADEPVERVCPLALVPGD